MNSNQIDFIKNIRDYFDLDLQERDENRILLYLNDYVGKLPQPKMPKPEVVYKERLVVKYVDKSIVEKIEISDEQLLLEAKEFCQRKGIDENLFLPPKKRGQYPRTRRDITPYRREFCQIMVALGVRRKQLQDLFKVHHTSIIYYVAPFRRLVKEMEVSQENQ